MAGIPTLFSASINIIKYQRMWGELFVDGVQIRMVNFGSLIPSFVIFNYIQMIFRYIQGIAVIADK